MSSDSTNENKVVTDSSSTDEKEVSPEVQISINNLEELLKKHKTKPRQRDKIRYGERLGMQIYFD